MSHLDASEAFADLDLGASRLFFIDCIGLV
jgi:hypothetical protein